MRLGNDLEVRNWTGTGESANVLTIDWRVFSADSDLQAQDIDMDVRTETRIADAPPSGTSLVITDLQSSWDEEKTKDVAARFLSRFINPFDSDAAQAVDIEWNGQPIDIPILSRRFLNASQNGMKGKLTIDKDKRFTLTINYWFLARDTGRRKTFSRTYSSADFGRLNDAAIAEVGPFTFELYHYNRLRVSAIEGFATRVDFKKWLDEWAGGLMLYRDGLRVMPYGRMPDDDWLELDNKALKSRGFRVNRIQIVGCVKISRLRNPHLRDQTNREGLRDNTAAKTFRRFLQRIIQELFVDFLDQESRAPGKTDEELITRSADLYTSVDEAVDRLTAAAESTDLRGVADATQELRKALSDMPQITADLREAVNVHAIQRLDVLELAATGMTAMSLAHDLEASLDTAMTESGALARSTKLDGSLRTSLEHLIALFKSLRTLVSDIKPGPAKSRRRKSTFDVAELCEQLKIFYAPALERGHIQVQTKVQPGRKPFQVKAVEGHVRQVLDNLLRNSIYWLNDTRDKRGEDSGPAVIRLMFDLRSETLSFTDTGVGVAPHDTEWIFEPFTTHREGGFGLGLHISKNGRGNLERLDKTCGLEYLGTVLTTTTQRPEGLRVATSTRRPYPSDLSPEQWLIIAPMLPPEVPAGRPRTTCLREVLNAIFYVLSTGCGWSALPHDFPPEGTVRDYFHQWRRGGLWQRIHDTLRSQVRAASGKGPQPSAGSIDSQTVKVTRTAGERGYDAGKKNQRDQATHPGGHARVAAGGRGPRGEHPRP